MRTPQWARRPGSIGWIHLLAPWATIGKTPYVADFERTPQGNNGAMVVLALILLVLVAVLVVAIVVSNPDVYDLSIFGAVVPANSAGIFITGAVAMAVTILALLLLRMGIRRGRARRTERRSCCRPRATSSRALLQQSGGNLNDHQQDFGHFGDVATPRRLTRPPHTQPNQHHQ